MQLTNTVTVTPASGTILDGVGFFTIDIGSTLSLANTLVFKNGTTIQNSGLISGAGTLQTQGPLTINSDGGTTAPFEAVSGTTTGRGNFGKMTIDSGATLQSGGGLAPRGDFTVVSGGTLNLAANNFSFQGPTFTNSGAVISTVSPATVIFNGINNVAGTTQNVAGAGTYNTNGRVDMQLTNTVTVTPASGTVINGVAFLTIDSGTTLDFTGSGGLTLAADVSNAGTVKLNGGGPACGDTTKILLRSSVPGTQRAWSGGGTFSLVDVDVKDQAGSASIAATGGVNSGNNGVNWNFPACAAPDVSVAVSPSSVAEDGATNLVYTFTRTAPTSGALTVNFSVGGTATFNTDYTQTGAASFNSSSGTVAFGAGNSTATVTVDPTADSTVEPDETVILTITSAPGYNVGSPSAATGTITNDDTDVSVAVSPSSVAEDGAPNLVYTFTRNGVTSGALTANFSVGGTATFNTDYTQSGAATFTSSSGTVTFGAGNSTATVTIDPTADSTAEPDETVILAVASGTGYNVGSPSAATGTITNDDTDVSVAVSPAAVQEDGATNLVYTFTRNGVTGGALTVKFSVSGTATFGTDYTQTGAATFGATSGTITFGAGDTTATVTVDPTADTTAEPDETVILTATSGTSYNVGSPSAATGTITNDDAVSIQFSASSYTVGEGDGRVDITVTRAGITSGAASVSFATSDLAGTQNCNVINGAASSRCDYETRITTVQFAAGETSKTISVFIIDDSYLEGTETFNVGLSNPSGATLGSPSTATVTITDNEIANGTNPIDTAGFFVRQHYLDFLNREPDTSGFNFWTNEITSCGSDQACVAVKRVNVSAAFFLSIEFQQTGYLVERIYKVSYGDATGPSTLGGLHQLTVPIIRLNELLPDTQEIGRGVIVNQGNWQQQLENNKQAFTLEFVQRSRFTAAFSTSLTPAQFVDKLFVNAGVTPSATDRTTAINEFGSTTTTSDVAARSRALRDVAENSTLNQQELNQAFVLMQYLGYLRRNPNDPPDSDYTGYDFWLTKLNQFNGNFQNAEMVKAFISSSEYRQRFGP
jgi:hypothetical protein